MTEKRSDNTRPPHVYDSLPEASRGLLCEVVKELELLKVKYVVIGGWCPVLRNRVESIAHPGTKDVDILFEDGFVARQLEPVIKHFRECGFLISAKHDFQLLRILRVKEEKCIFNVDLLHPSESTKAPEMFVHHLDLDIFEDEELKRIKTLGSIVLPASEIILEGYFSRVPVSGTLPNGREHHGTLSLVDEAGLVLSKCQSMQKQKRERDAFDVYLMLIQKNRRDTISQLAKICRRGRQYKAVFQKGVEFIDAHTTEFDQRVMKHLPEKPKESPASRVRDAFSEGIRLANGSDDNHQRDTQ